MTDTDRILPDWLDAYMEYSDNSEPPRSFRLWSAISAIAACLQRKCYFNWDGTLYPNLYIVLVGPSGSRKGTAMRPIQQFLRHHGIRMAAEATTRQKLIQKLKKAGGQNVEAGSVVIHSSLTIFSKELTVFLGYSNQELMSNLCDWFDCDSQWTYETISRNEETITNVWVNMIGATTPELIRISLPQEAVGGGLTSRIIFIVEEKKGRIVPVPRKTKKEMELEKHLLNDLGRIMLMKGEFSITDGWLERWLEWYPRQDAHPPFHEPRLEGYLTRRGIHVQKLCMIVNASRRDGNMVMTEEDFDRALSILKEAEKKMPRVFSGFGRAEYSASIHDVMRTIAKAGSISIGDLLRVHYQDVDMDTLHKICVTLHKIGMAKYDVGRQTIEYIKGGKDEER